MLPAQIHRLRYGRGSVTLFPGRECERPVLGPKVGAPLDELAVIMIISIEIG
jgi:hypothetical protein